MLEGITLKRSAIAYIHRQNPPLARAENMSFYDRVTASGAEITQFMVQGPELVLLRQPTAVQNGLEIRVGGFGPNPQLQQLRLLVNELIAGSGPPVMTLVRETADLVYDAFVAVWGEKATEVVLVEVTQEMLAPAPRGEARRFLAEDVAHLDPAALVHLGKNFQGFGIRLMAPPLEMGLDAGAPHVLPGADVELRVETFLGDNSQLHVVMTTRWPALTIPTHQLPPEVRSKVGGPVLQANIKAEKPSHYLDLSYEYVTKNVKAFLEYGSQ